MQWKQGVKSASTAYRHFLKVVKGVLAFQPKFFVEVFICIITVYD